MAQLTATFETYDMSSNIKEEVASKIEMITPEETPLTSLIGRKKVETVHPEWLIDELASPDTDNNRPEGAEWTFDEIVAPSRVGTYCQISDKRLVISRTADDIAKHGRKKEVARMVAKRGVELRIDRELICLSNQASSAGTEDGGSNRKTAGLRAWIATNDQLGATGSSGGFNTSTKVVDAATNGTQRAFDKAGLDAAILAAYTAGGNPSIVMVSPYNKMVFSTWMDDANVAQPRVEYSRSKKNAILAAADVYVSDFGTFDVVPNRQMARKGADWARNVFVLDPEMVWLGIFHDISINDVAKTGDATKKALVTEWCLVMPNEKAHAVVADTYGMSAST
jgi:hypothetical protein